MTGDDDHDDDDPVIYLSLSFRRLFVSHFVRVFFLFFLFFVLFFF